VRRLWVHKSFTTDTNYDIGLFFMMLFRVRARIGRVQKIRKKKKTMACCYLADNHISRRRSHGQNKIYRVVIRCKEAFGARSGLLKELLREVLEETLEHQMDETLGAQKGERTSTRIGYRSGYYSRTLITRVDKLELRIPQDRQGNFSPQLFERYQRSEKTLVSALAEMYIQGVSTRKVKAITEELCGHAFSASSISSIVKKLDDQLALFAHRGL
jgi:hypothetical protein